MSGILYKLDFASGKSYIGVTKRALWERIRDHRCVAKSGGGEVIHAAWRKYGEPIVTKLAIVETGMMSETERAAIAVFNAMVPHGYNVTSGGYFGYEFPPSVRKKISAAITGITRSKETRKKISDSLRGKVCTDEHKAKTSLKLTGRTLSESHKIKIGNAHRGIVRGPNPLSHMKIPGRAKLLGAARRGIHLSEAHKEKLRAAWVIRKAKAKS